MVSAAAWCVAKLDSTIEAPCRALQVLHLLAMARAAGVELTIDDFQRVSDRVPFIADLKPSGRYVMEDVHKVETESEGSPCLSSCRTSGLIIALHWSWAA